MRTLGLLLALACTTAAAQTATITGPAEAAPGDLVILDASGSDADSAQWVLANSDKAFLTFEDGHKLVFASGTPGPYTFVLAVSKGFPDGTSRVAITKHTLTVSGVLPQPQPGPGPVPPGPGPTPPRPDPADALTGLARQAYDKARPLDRRPGEATKMAEVFESTASKAAGLSWNVQTIARELQAAATASVTTDADTRARWAPFNTLLAAAMSNATASDAIERLNQLAEGLRVVDAAPAASGDAANESLRQMIDGIRQDLGGIRQEVGS